MLPNIFFKFPKKRRSINQFLTHQHFMNNPKIHLFLFSLEVTLLVGDHENGLLNNPLTQKTKDTPLFKYKGISV